jgi:hypothetical protein
MAYVVRDDKATTGGFEPVSDLRQDHAERGQAKRGQGQRGRS